MNKRFKNMALAIIPLSVMVMSYASNDYAKAAVNNSNHGSKKDDVNKSSKDIIGAAAKIQSELSNYYNGTLSYVKGDFINDLAQAINYDPETQDEFAKEIQAAKDSVTFEQ